MISRAYMNPHRWAHLLVIAFIVALLSWGCALLSLPPIYKLARAHNPLLYYQGHLLMIFATILACFHRWVAQKLLWIAQEIHRAVSAILMVSIIGIDGAMHLLSIPHMEGWWLPIVGGSTFLTGIAALLPHWRKKPKDLPTDGV